MKAVTITTLGDSGNSYRNKMWADFYAMQPDPSLPKEPENDVQEVTEKAQQAVKDIVGESTYEWAVASVDAESRNLRDKYIEKNPCQAASNMMGSVRIATSMIDGRHGVITSMSSIIGRRMEIVNT